MDQKITVPIEGMTCGGCSSSVDRILRKLSGVVDVDVQLSPGQATVVVQEASVSREAIVAAVQTAGFVVPA